MRRVPPPPAWVVGLSLTAVLSAGGATALMSQHTASPPAARDVPAPAPAATSRVAGASASPRPAPSPLVVPSPVVQRRTFDTEWRAFAVLGPVTLHYPADVVEIVGFHESNNDGARQQRPVRSGVPSVRLDSRERGTLGLGAADIVVSPLHAIRAPVSGRVIRAGTYTLYCDYRDVYVVIEPDARPGWEVKVLHFEGLAVRKGDRVRAGVSVVGSRARKLPFASQVDEHTVAPHWPHVHVEVVDPTIPDRPSKPCD